MTRCNGECHGCSFPLDYPQIARALNGIEEVQDKAMLIPEPGVKETRKPCAERLRELPVVRRHPQVLMKEEESLVIEQRRACLLIWRLLEDGHGIPTVLRKELEVVL